MIIALVVAILAAIVLAVLLILHIREEYLLAEQLNQIMNTQTNLEITTTLRIKSIQNMAVEINSVLKRHKALSTDAIRKQGELSCAITNISHDLRTPLTSISGYLQMLRNDKVSSLTDEKRSEYLNIVERRIESVRKLLDDLLVFTRLGSGEYPISLERINLSNKVRDVLSLYYDDFVRKGVSPVLEIPDAVWAKCDANAIERVLLNLFSNAIRYGQEDLHVSLESGKSVRLVVSNSAPLLTEADAAKLFDRFYSGEHKAGGVGLGLSIAYGLTTKMNGTLTSRYKDGILSIMAEFPPC